MLYPNLCYNEVCYKGTTLYVPWICSQTDCAMGPFGVQHNKGEITYCWVKGLVKNRNERMIVTAFLHVVTEI